MNKTPLSTIEHGRQVAARYVVGFMLDDGDEVRPVTNRETHDFLSYRKHEACTGADRGDAQHDSLTSK
jgi:hypothetical protein